jgi:hypothetical protein
VAFLFERYQQLTAPLVVTEKPVKKKKGKTNQHIEVEVHNA